MISNPSEEIRSQFLLRPDVIFLNHGSFGATPRPVFEVYQNWQRQLEDQPVEFLGRKAPELLRQARQELSVYLGTVAENLVFVNNATTGLNILARSLDLKKGDEVLSSDHEYGALDRTWKFLSARQGFKYTNHCLTLPVTTPEVFVEDFWKAVTEQTRVIFLSHITSPTAMIFPVREICKRARQAGILTIIDGAHSPGQIPLDLDDLGADFYIGNLHKWLCAPKGSAFLFARPEVQHLVQPLIVSWGWESDHPSESRFIDILEWTGTQDISAYLSVPAAIQFQQEHRWDEIRQYCHSLANQTQQQIGRLTGLPHLHPNETTWYAQMGAALLPANTNINGLKSWLYEECRIEVPLIEWHQSQLIRFSYQAYNSPSDMDALLSSLKTGLPMFSGSTPPRIAL